MLRWTLIALAVFMVATVTWQVLSRYVFRAPSSLTEEIARFQLIWLGLLGSVYTFRNRMHVGIDILIGALKGRPRLLAELASLIACITFAVLVLIIGGTRLVMLTSELDQTSAALGVRMAWVYSIIPISGVLWVLYGLYYIADIARHGRMRLPSELNWDADSASHNPRGEPVATAVPDRRQLDPPSDLDQEER